MDVENVETVEASFAVLGLCLEQLSDSVPIKSPQQILDVIPDISAASKRLIAVELMKLDLASAAEQGITRFLEFYWPEIGDVLPQDEIPIDLVVEEVKLRKVAGEEPNWAEYKQRFPDLADTMAKWLAGAGDDAFSGATVAVPDLEVGTVFDDFDVLKQLGQGAFARVYLARQLSMHRLVALKATTRGSEEPQALSQLDHVNIVRVYDQRTVKEPKTILLYMQYVAGGTLADCVKHVRDLPESLWNGKHILEAIDSRLLDASQTVPEKSMIRQRISEMNWPEVVAWIGIQLAEGLHYATEKGVLHRDVKPANILLSAEAIPKLADFNVSCSGLSGRAGAAAYFGGSLAYMSPEQLAAADPTDQQRAEDLDGRSDLYSLGIVLWELWQGRRPWSLHGLAASWPDAVKMQRNVRILGFDLHHSANSAAERVLEKALCGMLEVAPDLRPANGREAAARLKLAFYPELANRFEPGAQSLAGRLLNTSVVLLAALIIFGPNTAAAVFNYTYNRNRMVEYCETTSSVNQAASSNQSETLALPPDALVGTSVKQEPTLSEDCAMLDYFELISGIVNGVVFPLGGILFGMVIWPFTQIIHRGKLGKPADSKSVSYLWTIGYRATLITAVLWSVSGLIFAVSMWIRFPSQFGSTDALHFFLSLVLCGGVAWIYPYFGMTMLSLLVYYPKVIARSMSDPQFDGRSNRIRSHSFWYLLSAAAIPLTAIAALVMGSDAESVNKTYILAGVAVTALGLGFAYFAHTRIDDVLRQYAKVLGHQSTSGEV